MTDLRPPLPTELVDERVIVIARGHDRATLRSALPVLLEHERHVIEVTLDSPDAVAGIAALRATDGVRVGAGTVRDATEVRAAADGGAEFVVTPVLDETVIGACLDLGLPCIAGAFTATEVARAWDLGASAVKVFPAGALGPSYLTAVRGPLPHVPLVATGLVTGDDAAAYLDAGALAVGIGSWLPVDRPTELSARLRTLDRTVRGLA